MNRNGRYRIALSALLSMSIAIALIVLVAGTREVGAQDSATVTIADFAFSPGSITVQAGATVTWLNNDSVAHTATGDNGEFDAGQIAPGGSATITFDTAGTFSYHCTLHPNMTASITVQGGGGTNPTPTQAATQPELPNTGAGAGSSATGLVTYAAIAGVILAIGGYAVRRRSA